MTTIDTTLPKWNPCEKVTPDGINRMLHAKAGGQCVLEPYRAAKSWIMKRVKATLKDEPDRVIELWEIEHQTCGFYEGYWQAICDIYEGKLKKNDRSSAN